MLATQLNHLITENEIQEKGVIQLDRYISNTVNDHRIIIILGVTVISGPIDLIGWFPSLLFPPPFTLALWVGGLGHGRGRLLFWVLGRTPLDGRLCACGVAKAGWCVHTLGCCSAAPHGILRAYPKPIAGCTRLLVC